MQNKPKWQGPGAEKILGLRNSRARHESRARAQRAAGNRKSAGGHASVAKKYDGYIARVQARTARPVRRRSRGGRKSSAAPLANRPSWRKASPAQREAWAGFKTGFALGKRPNTPASAGALAEVVRQAPRKGDKNPYKNGLVRGLFRGMLYKRKVRKLPRTPQVDNVVKAAARKGFFSGRKRGKRSRA